MFSGLRVELHMHGSHSPYLAWLSMRSGGRVTPSAAASLPVNSKSLWRDSYDSMNLFGGAPTLRGFHNP